MLYGCPYMRYTLSESIKGPIQNLSTLGQICRVWAVEAAASDDPKAARMYLTVPDFNHPAKVRLRPYCARVSKTGGLQSASVSVNGINKIDNANNESSIVK